LPRQSYHQLQGKINGSKPVRRVPPTLFALVATAQQPRQYTKQDYAQAEKFMPYNLNPLSYSGVVRAHWLDDAASGIVLPPPMAGTSSSSIRKPRPSRLPSIQPSWPPIFKPKTTRAISRLPILPSLKMIRLSS